MTDAGLAEIAARAEQQGVAFVDLQFVDILGMVKSVTIPTHRLRHAEQHRQWFDGSAVEGFARVSESDMYLKPDLSTFAVVPWQREAGRAARVICDVYTPSGKPFAGDPRQVLKSIISVAAEAGFVYNVGPEIEFFLFERGQAGEAAAATPHDQAGYFDLARDLGYDVRRRMVSGIEAMGIEVETSHHEVAPGQHEIDLRYLPSIAAADAITTVKWLVREVAQRNSLHASFMPKPFFGQSGSGLHLHQSLFDSSGDRNLFLDPSDPYHLSKIARHFIAGQLAHAAGMTVVLAPIVNSYKRLVAGYEAPVSVTWARTNRSALLRVPETAPDEPEATRVELRLADPSCNPYLALAVTLAAGLDGIERELPLPEPFEEDLGAALAGGQKFNVPLLPTNLHDGLDALERDDLLCEVLGPSLLERFLDAKRIEWEAYRTQITPWELHEYLPLY